MALRCKHGLALIASGAAGMALLGCSDTLSLADLPSISRLPSKLLSREEQAKTMNHMLEKGQNHQADAVRAIEAEDVDTAGIATTGIGAAEESAPAQ